MTVQNDLAIILPSLDPDYKFKRVIDELVEGKFKNIVIVDDGSDDSHQEYFDYADKYPECYVIHHDGNKGKGRALKTAFQFVIDNLPDALGAITIDGDGQHLTKDIINCGEVMLQRKNEVVLGSRDFDQPGVPPRSVAGNKTTAKMFKLLFNIDITDTQTGLRAIPRQYLELFTRVEGERFEYETNMLLQMKRDNIKFYEQKIETVYDQEDYSSHYNAVKDSLRVAKVMLKFLFSGCGFKYLVSSVVSVLVDNGIFYLLTAKFGVASQIILQSISTFLSSVLNFNLNKYFAFKTKGNYLKEIVQYYCICIPRTAVSILMTHFVLKGLVITSPSLATAAKFAVDIILFFVVYFIQKKWIFKK